MAQVILNRDLLPKHVPRTQAQALHPPGEGHELEWARVWRFALSFDPAAYEANTGITLDVPALIDLFQAQRSRDGAVSGALAELRAALNGLYDGTGDGASVSAEAADLIDGLLDAIYAHVAGGAPRPNPDPPLYEPGIGVRGELHGSGQHRFVFAPTPDIDRVDLFDRVAGLLLRDVREDVIVSALFLHPPTYALAPAEPRLHTFTVLLAARREDMSDDLLMAEYARLEALVESLLARATV